MDVAPYVLGMLFGILIGIKIEKAKTLPDE